MACVLYRIMAAILVAVVTVPDVSAADETPRESTTAGHDAYVQESVRGRVGWLSEILSRRFAVESDPDVAEAYVALETNEGRILPLVKDDRGRGFWVDERIRDIQVELYVRRYQDSPLVQVIRVYTIKDGKRYEMDYWCDVCAIPMFELKPCECCQGPTVIRERLVPLDGEPADLPTPAN